MGPFGLQADWLLSCTVLRKVRLVSVRPFMRNIASWTVELLRHRMSDLPFPIEVADPRDAPVEIRYPGECNVVRND